MGKVGSRRVFKYIFLAATIAVLAFVLFGAVYVLGLDAWHEFDENKILKADRTLLVFDSNGNEAARLHSAEDRIPVLLEDVPDHVQKAFISAEDARFYEHGGIDVIRIFGAAWADIKAGAFVQGASTISQQLVKLSHLTNEKRIERKLEEAVMAYQMEQRFSKDEILEMYLNYVYFGGGYYGIEAAARGYFGVSVGKLTLSQGAQLAGVLKSPTNYAPHIDLDASIRRRNVVLEEMLEYGYISQEEYRNAKNETVNILHGRNEEKRGYYIDEALREACSLLDVELGELLRGGYRVYTAMDSELQEYAETLFLQDDSFPAENAEGALIIVNAKDATVAAMMGGREPQVAMGLNRAVSIKRQPGSVIKPVIAYAPALESFSYTAASMLLDEKTDFNGYIPNNFGERYSGWVTLRDAVSRSLNVPAVKVLSSIGVSSGKQFAKKLGIEFAEQDDGLALALGGFTYGVSPYQIAGAYSCFASGGIYRKPEMILKITDAMGNILYERKDSSVQAMSEENAYILTSMLETAINEGTGKRLGESYIPLSGKTGTVGDANGNRDAWMVAYNPEYVATVWMGYDTSAEGEALKKDVTGGTYPALMLKNVFEQIYNERTAPVFAMPDGVAEYRIDLHTLQTTHEAALATALTPSESVMREVFVKGTEPVTQSDYWNVPEPPHDLTLSKNITGRPNISFTAQKPDVIYRLYREDVSGASVMLKEWCEVTGEQTYIDNTALADVQYHYYVIPAHPLLKIDGRQVTGAASIRVSFVPSDERDYSKTEPIDHYIAVP